MARKKAAASGHHHVYVVYLRDPKGDGRAGYYVGMTGLTPEERFHNHKNGVKAARVVRKYGERLVPRLYAHLNPMPFKKAVEMEVLLADSLRKRGYRGVRRALTRSCGLQALLSSGGDWMRLQDIGYAALALALARRTRVRTHRRQHVGCESARYSRPPNVPRTRPTTAPRTPGIPTPPGAMSAAPEQLDPSPAAPRSRWASDLTRRSR